MCVNSIGATYFRKSQSPKKRGENSDNVRMDQTVLGRTNLLIASINQIFEWTFRSIEIYMKDMHQFSCTMYIVLKANSKGQSYSELNHDDTNRDEI